MLVVPRQANGMVSGVDGYTDTPVLPYTFGLLYVNVPVLQLELPKNEGSGNDCVDGMPGMILYGTEQVCIPMPEIFVGPTLKKA